MTRQSVPRRPLTSRLGFQLAFLLAAVLLPLTVISAVNSITAFNEMHARSRVALTGETSRAGAPILQLIQKARGAAAVLALTVRPALTDEARCSRLMRDVQMDESKYALAGFIPLDGQMRCTSFGKPIDFTAYPFFAALISDPRPAFSVNYRSPVWGTAVLGISHPVFDDTGAYRGIIYISLPQSSLNPETAQGDDMKPLDLVTFDRTGEILTATSGLDKVSRTLPRDRSLAALVGPNPTAFSARSVDGVERVFSIVPLVKGEFFALGTWPAAESRSVDEAMIATPLLMPALIWLASLIVAWVSVELLVNRHVRKLSSSFKSFASGDRRVGDIDVSGAPLEIREMASAYERMTEAVMRDEADLENTVHQKEVLLREVHHRVKNNLQLIASIMNMQMRKAQSPEVKALIKGLQDRVMSLATVHRDLYQTTGLTDVHAGELLSSITRQIANMASAPGHRFDIRTHFADVHLTPDQAVPLALLLAEALTNAMKYASPAGSGAPLLEVQLTRAENGQAALLVANSVANAATFNLEDTVAGAGLGAQLLQAFALQLGGQVVRQVVDDTYRLEVTFGLRPLSDAEARNSNAEPDPE
jgi:two-component system, sensor histidine kinase PdtaS